MRIVGTGSATPKNILTNDMLATMVDTNDEWIRTRTGIRERRIAEHETTLSLAHEAAEKALQAAEEAGITRDQIGTIICATVTNENRVPSLACHLQRDLGLRNKILAFDLNGACSGFIYALITAAPLLRKDSCALIIGSEVLSRFVDFTDRSTCVLFGDGAGAAVLAPSASPETTCFEWVAEAQGNSELLDITDCIHMDGQGVFKFAVEALTENIRRVIEKSCLSIDDINLFICHQANERIIKSAAKRLGIPIDRFVMNIERYANTSAASIPLALDEAVKKAALAPNDRIVLAGFGGGMTAGAICFTWN